MRRAFVERRTDVRIEFETGSPPRIVETRRAGIAIDLEDGRRTTIHRTIDPPPGAGPEATDVDVGEGLTVAERATAASSGTVAFTIRGAWIASDQRIAIVDRDGRAISDRRRGSRLVLDAGFDRPVGLAARADRIGGPGRPIDPSEAVTALDERLRVRRQAESATPGETAAVFAAGVGGALIHELIGHALEGDVADARLLAEGFEFAHPDVRVVDDPRRGRVPWAIDDEGEASRAVGLVDRGRVTGRLLDRARAAALGATSTGHGRRASYLDPVRPRMGCTFLAAGRDDPAEIVADTPSGILVRRMEAAWADPIAGAAWFRVVDADRIDEGRIGRSLRPFLLEIALEDLRTSLDRVAHDMTVDVCIATCVKGGQPLAVSVGAPTIRSRVVRVVA